MAVALCRNGFGRSTRHRARPWRHDDGGVWMTLGNSPGDLILIVGAVDGEGGDWASDLVERCASHRSIVDIFPDHLDGDDLAAVGIHADMQLAPGSARDVPCFSTSHSPAPPSFRQVLSTSKCSGPVPLRRSGGTSSVLARRLSVEWSGTARSSPSRPMTEPISPSVCRSARPKTVRKVSAVVIAKTE
jgi:hypothetical protein